MFWTQRELAKLYTMLVALAAVAIIAGVVAGHFKANGAVFAAIGVLFMLTWLLAGVYVKTFSRK